MLNLWSTLIFAVSCIIGGWLSDRYRPAALLALFIFLTATPTLWLAWTMRQAGWIMPIDPATAPGRRAVGRPHGRSGRRRSRSTCLARGSTTASASALFMDVTDARGRGDAVHRLHGDV